MGDPSPKGAHDNLVDWRDAMLFYQEEAARTLFAAPDEEASQDSDSSSHPPELQRMTSVSTPCVLLP